MILRKYMSIIGIGAAKIDLVLPQKAYRIGECLQGYFLIKGGVIEQKLKRIECDLVMVDQSTGIEKVMDTTNILTSKFINSEETNKLSFKYRLPSDIPLSTKEISYHFKTKLFFNEGVDSSDQDVIEIIE
ncbi:sporulation protein [Rossellomorea sp. BNER]|jgi:sporulation-control protein|uniref:sporulation protein n=1 Tax=Rossellomorea sp. BNER TaxID=2962031 RepID=UPI003AF21FC4|nr:sporulation protein [Rossellomorea sp. BNER]